MFSGPIRGGTRGGQGDFKWTDVADDKDRENYLGHSILAPVGRWQKNRDITWYNKDAINNPSLNEDEQAQILRKRKEEEVRLIKMAEEEALSVALGFKPTSKGIGTSSNAITTTLGNSMETEVVDREDPATRRAAEKEEKAARKLARAAKRAARANRDSSRGRRRPHSRSPPPPRHRLSSRSPPRHRHTSRSPPRHWDNDGRREKEWRGRKEERVRTRSRSMDKDWGRERMARGGPRGRRDEDHPRSRSPPSLPRRQRSPSPQINHSDEERRYRHRHGR